MSSLPSAAPVSPAVAVTCGPGTYLDAVTSQCLSCLSGINAAGQLVDSGHAFIFPFTQTPSGLLSTPYGCFCEIEVLVVGGGGAGGGNIIGGGGGSGGAYQTPAPVDASNVGFIEVTVGAGGLGQNGNGLSGTSSTVLLKSSSNAEMGRFEAGGGGGGGSQSSSRGASGLGIAAAANGQGGSGGGGARSGAGGGAGPNGGFVGGSGASYGGGGGGASGGGGTSASSNRGKNGGVGKVLSLAQAIGKNAVAGGGGGAGPYGSGGGGSGIGGRGGYYSARFIECTSGVANTGSGGGGNYSGHGCKGADGLVVIKLKTCAVP